MVSRGAVDVHVLSSFCTRDGIGGTCAVLAVDEFPFRENVLRTIAAERRTDVTAVDRNLESSPQTVRFYFSTGEMIFCGHGLVALGKFLQRRTREFKHRVAIGNEVVLLESRVLTHDMGFCEFTTRVGTSRGMNDAQERACLLALGLVREDCTARPRVVGAARKKVVIELDGENRLDDVAPDGAVIDAACDFVGATGLYVVVRRSASTFVTRQFSAHAGFTEDHATGTAAVALATLLRERNELAAGREIVIRQGAPTGTRSELHVRLTSDDRVAVGGYVVG